MHKMTDIVEVTKHELTVVSLMNLAFQNPHGSINNINWSRIQSQVKNVRDEYNEMIDAISELNVIQTRDSLVDIKVFAHGAIHLMGYSFEDFADEVDAFYDIVSAKAAQLNPEHSVLATISAWASENALDLLSQIEKVEKAATAENLNNLVVSLAHVCAISTVLQVRVLKVDVAKEMDAVIDGLMTRFVKDESDEIATYAKHNKAFHAHYAKNNMAVTGDLEVYFVGEYPVRVMKSSVDQPDAPKDKFLKSASFKEPVFPEYEHLQ